MGRSKWKFYHVASNTLRYLKKTKLNFYKPKNILIVFNRSSHILNVVKKVYIHKGNTFIIFLKTKFNVYQRYGFFSFTRRPYVYKLKK
jgi:ribosomal protein S19